MRKTFLAGFAAVALLLGSLAAGSAAQAASTSSPSASATATSPSATGPNASVIGHFKTAKVSGYSHFYTKGSQVRVISNLTNLTPGQGYFTVVYANKNCDPAQAIPTGPVVADASGKATLETTVNGPAAGLKGAGSVSVRFADDGNVGAPAGNDVDGDGIVGPIDVVAVPGQPSVGLLICDSNPSITNQ